MIQGHSPNCKGSMIMTEFGGGVGGVGGWAVVYREEEDVALSFQEPRGDLHVNINRT